MKKYLFTLLVLAACGSDEPSNFYQSPAPDVLSPSSPSSDSLSTESPEASDSLTEPLPSPEPEKASHCTDGKGKDGSKSKACK